MLASRAQAKAAAIPSVPFAKRRPTVWMPAAHGTYKGNRVMPARHEDRGAAPMCDYSIGL